MEAAGVVRGGAGLQVLRPREGLPPGPNYPRPDRDPHPGEPVGDNKGDTSNISLYFVTCTDV